MKKIILAFCFALLAMGTQAQSYESVFGKTQTSWNIFTGTRSYYTDSFYVANDTVIKGNNYKTVINLPATAMSPGGSIQYLREDTATGRIWYRPNTGDTDILIMDLSLQVGDSFDFDIWPYPKVDTIYTQSGRKHIRFNPLQFSSTGVYKKVMFIEGIGPNYGIYPLYEGLLLCMRKDSVRIYTHEAPLPNYFYKVGDCAYYMQRESVDETQKPALNVQAYPNPAGHNVAITFTNPNNTQTQLEVINLMGQVLHSNTTNGEGFALTNLDTWPTGIYLYRLSQQGQVVYTGKLCKQ